MSTSKPIQDVDECLDQSSENFFVLVFFTVSDPGYEYEIFEKEDVECNSTSYPEEGDNIRIKFGPARCQGIVVKVSNNLKRLKKNFNKLVQMHQDKLREHKAKTMASHSNPQHSRNHVRPMNVIPTNYKMKHELFLEKNQIKSEKNASTSSDKETQTDRRSAVLDPEFIELENKYEVLKAKYKRLYSFVSGLQKNMGKSMKKIKHFNLGAIGEAGYCTDEEEEKENNNNFSKMIQIGCNGTRIPKQVYDTVNWVSYTAATRKLLITLFPRKVLATHSLTGKRSPAFLTSDKEAKARLDPDIISDIVQVVSMKSRVTESLVRSAITTKCADENKLYKKRLENGTEEGDETVASSKRNRIS